MLPIDSLLLIGSILILCSIGLARISDNLGIPSLLLFLGVGMLAGSEGPGGIYFDDAELAQGVGIAALIVILFSGGLETDWRQAKTVFRPSLSLATLGVLITAFAVGIFAVSVLDLPLLVGLLLGAIISSTDAAAVFAVLRSKSITLRGALAPLLEFESGSNDPMAVFLTLGLLMLAAQGDASPASLIGLFLKQMGLGAICGIFMGKAFVYLANWIRLPSAGIYPIFMLAFATLSYALAATLGGSGFLSVYVAGLIIGNSEFVHKKSLTRFFSSMAWLGQIGMFLTLGLLVFPSQLVPVASRGILVSAFLIFVARPAGVFLSLAVSKLSLREKLFISWVGLRGAVPIILATFPLVGGFSGSHVLFNLVFFIVLTSALIQGWSLPLVARLLRVDAPVKRRAPVVDFEGTGESDMDTVDLIVPYRADAAGKAVVELGLPRDVLLVLIVRGEDYLVPNGETVLEEGDSIVALVCARDLPSVRATFSKLKAAS